MPAERPHKNGRKPIGVNIPCLAIGAVQFGWLQAESLKRAESVPAVIRACIEHVRLGNGEPPAELRPQRAPAAAPVFNGRRVYSVLDPDQYTRLADEANRQNIPIAELIRTYIEWGLENDS